MKILFVGVLDIPWSTNIPMTREFERLGHKVIPFNYRTIAMSYALAQNSRKYKIKDKVTSFLRRLPIPAGFRTLYYHVNGREDMNKQLLREVQQGSYDLVFFAKADSVDYRLIPEINKHSTSWYFFMDPPDQARRIIAKKYAKLATWSSATFSDVNDSFKRYGAHSHFITQGVDKSIFTPENIEKRIDVIFVGTKDKSRWRIIDFLKNNGVRVECYGDGWINGPIYQQLLNEKYKQSRIILNLCRRGMGFSIRVFQAMGSGSFLLSEHCRDLDEMFIRKEHLDWFETPKECLDLICNYLAHEREREIIASNGSKYVLEKYSWKEIIKKICGIIEGN